MNSLANDLPRRILTKKSKRFHSVFQMNCEKTEVEKNIKNESSPACQRTKFGAAFGTFTCFLRRKTPRPAILLGISNGGKSQASTHRRQRCIACRLISVKPQRCTLQTKKMWPEDVSCVRPQEWAARRFQNRDRQTASKARPPNNSGKERLPKRTQKWNCCAVPFLENTQVPACTKQASCCTDRKRVTGCFDGSFKLKDGRELPAGAPPEQTSQTRRALQGQEKREGQVQHNGKGLASTTPSANWLETHQGKSICRRYQLRQCISPKCKYLHVCAVQLKLSRLFPPASSDAGGGHGPR